MTVCCELWNCKTNLRSRSRETSVWSAIRPSGAQPHLNSGAFLCSKCVSVQRTSVSVQQTSVSVQRTSVSVQQTSFRGVCNAQHLHRNEAKSQGSSATTLSGIVTSL